MGEKEAQTPMMDPRQILGVDRSAGDEEIRSAYLRKVKEHPPEQSPELFEQIRDAYETLKDPRKRMAAMLFAADPNEPLVSLIRDELPQRRFCGPEPWLVMATKPFIPNCVEFDCIAAGSTGGAANANSRSPSI